VHGLGVLWLSIKFLVCRGQRTQKSQPRISFAKDLKYFLPGRKDGAGNPEWAVETMISIVNPLNNWKPSGLLASVQRLGDTLKH
jgi:hypothetical protein